MKYSILVNLISKHLADELVSEDEMLSYMDRVIDDINARLNTVFPTFTEYKLCTFSQPNTCASIEDLTELDPDYTAIPDKYLRMVIVPGAAFKYYTTDEEGGISAPKYEEEYKTNLFYMERDYSFQIPEQYRAEKQGYVQMNLCADAGLNAQVNRGMF